MKKIIFFFELVSALMVVNAKEAIIIPLGEAPLIKLKFDHDPSLNAVSNDVVTAKNPKPFLERWRIVSDLNGDGINDLILSEPKQKPWTSEASWMVYIHTNSIWSYQGDVVFRPDMVTLERTYNGVNIWKYIRLGGREGFLGYDRFVNGKLDRKTNRIHIAHEDEDDCIFLRLNNAVFGHSSTLPFRLESSETSTNGVVSWKFIRDELSPCRKSEVYELKQRVVELEKRANEAELKLQRANRSLENCTRGMFEFNGIALGTKWDGSTTNRLCTEEFSGFTNLTVVVDANNFVSAIRLTRQGSIHSNADSGIHIRSAPTDEEQKILHQVENRFNIRLEGMISQKGRIFYWGDHLRGNWIKVYFANKDDSASIIEMIYSRNFGR